MTQEENFGVDKLFSFIFERMFYFSVGAIAVYYFGVGASIVFVLGWILFMLISFLIYKRKQLKKLK